MRESAIEKTVRKIAVRYGGDAYKFSSPGRTGVPDRVVVRGVGSPAGRVGVLWVEVKAPGGRLSPRQRLELAALEKHGQDVAVVWSVEEVEEVVGDFMHGVGLYAPKSSEACPFCGETGVEVVEAPGSFRRLIARCGECGASAPEVRIKSGDPETWEARKAEATVRALAEWTRRA